jgi:hypothetical protein
MNAVSNGFLGPVYKPRLEINKRIQKISDATLLMIALANMFPEVPT